MVLRWTLLSTLLLATFALPEKRTYDTHSYYVLRHNPLSYAASLADVVDALDVELVEQVGELRDHWVVKRRKYAGDLAAREISDPVLSRFESLKARAASPVMQRSESGDIARRLVSSVDYLSLQTLRHRVKRAPPPALPPPPEPHSKVVANHFGIQDPLFSKQWHIINDEFPQFMMNVTGVWDMGLTGKGIISSFVDDGLDYTSEDLIANFDANNSYDYNTHQKLPTPVNYDDHHGTRCAGQVAALKNNVCGIGLAYDSKVAGVRILSGPITDVDEAAALNYGYQNVSIFSCSWGPPDSGQSMEGPNYLIKKAFVNGITNGRGGKGSIFVFASGNGAYRGDQCNFDGYTNSIYSVTVAAVDFRGLHPYYSESCAANMIVAYSSGSGQHIVTTDKGKNACATTHGGTSAAAPNAVGVFALALEARPELTWRDIQHLCVETASIINPDDPDWEKTASGRKYSYKYGYGIIDAYKYVTASQQWKLVKPQAWYQSQTVQLKNGTFGEDGIYSGGEHIPAGGIESKIEITRQELDEHNLEVLEHINVKVWIEHKVRGDVEVEIVSPNGIRSVLGGARSADLDSTGYPGWTFMTLKHWGENPVGNWVLKVKDQNNPNVNGTFLGWNMVLWGSSIDPTQAKNYEVPVIDNRLPPIVSPESISVPSPSTTKQHTKPTAHLPGDHGIATGENTKPAFPTVTGSGAGPTATISPPTVSGTPDVGWFSDLGKLVKNQKWFFGALALVSLFGISAGVFFWRRRSNRLADYSSLNNDDAVGMTALGSSMSPRTTRELYDAFGEVSDDDDNDDDETTALRPPIARQVGFHSEFQDDEPSATGATPAYRDEPEDLEEARRYSRDGEQSSSPSGSGDSWEHASRD